MHKTAKLYKLLTYDYHSHRKGSQKDESYHTHHYVHGGKSMCMKEKVQRK